MTRQLLDKEIEELLCGFDKKDSDKDDFDTQDQVSQEPSDAEVSTSSESDDDSKDDVPLSTLRTKRKKYNSKSMPEHSFPDVNPIGRPVQYLEKYFTQELIQFALCTN